MSDALVNYYSRVFYKLYYLIKGLFMPGRGKAKEYADEAAKHAVSVIEDYFEGSSDAVQAAVVAGVFGLYEQNVIPSYILETEDY